MSDFFEGDIIAVPDVYRPEFARSPASSLLQYGPVAQRAQIPFFTDASLIDLCLSLPDRVTGPRSADLTSRKSTPEGWQHPLTLVASRDRRALIDGLDPEFAAPLDGAYWHFSMDLALNSRRRGDRAGIALGRIHNAKLERHTDALGQMVQRLSQTYEIPMVAQVAAPEGEQIYLSSIVNLVLHLKQERGFNITSFSADGFQSAGLAQELMHAGMVTSGLHVDPVTGVITGTPTPFSVDRTTAPYNELLEAIAERRVRMPAYMILRREMRGLEQPEPGRAPDHGTGDDDSKDVADAVAGLVGYLARFKHTELDVPQNAATTNRQQLEAEGLLPAADSVELDDEAFDPAELMID